MKLIENKGIKLFPNPPKHEILKSSNVLVVTECYCPNGHNLIDKRSNFNGFKGVVLRVTHDKKIGFVALSPVYGDKSRIFIDIDVEKGDILKLFCPHCNIPIPELQNCKCGSKIHSLFSTPKLEHSNCIGVCDRVDCVNAELINENQPISMSAIDPCTYY